MKRLVLGGAVGQVLSIIATLVAARSLGAPLFAEAATISAVGTTAGAFSAFGVNSHHIRLLASGQRLLSQVIDEFVGRVCIAGVLAAIVGILLVSAQRMSIPGLFTIIMLATASQLEQCALVPLFADGRYREISWITAADKTVFVLCSLGLLSGSWLSPVTFCAAFAIGNLVGTACACRTWLSMSVLPRRVPGLARMWRLYGQSHWVGFAQVSFSAQQLDIPVARLASPGVATGQYAAVARWSQPIVLLASAAGSTTLRDASLAQNDREAIETVRRTVRRPFALATALAVLAAIGAYAATPLILGSGYSGSRVPAVILLLGAPFSFLSQVFINLLVARHNEKAAGLGAAVLVALQLLAVYPLTMVAGASGPAIACTGMQIVYCLALSRQIRKMLSRTEPRSQLRLPMGGLE